MLIALLALFAAGDAIATMLNLFRLTLGGILAALGRSIAYFAGAALALILLVSIISSR